MDIIKVGCELIIQFLRLVLNRVGTIKSYEVSSRILYFLLKLEKHVSVLMGTILLYLLNIYKFFYLVSKDICFGLSVLGNHTIFFEPIATKFGYISLECILCASASFFFWIFNFFKMIFLGHWKCAWKLEIKKKKLVEVQEVYSRETNQNLVKIGP